MDPIPLIFDDFSVNKKALKVMENEIRPIIIITVVGPYRSGKSYLLNRIMGKSDGFPLGATVQAQTKGIWMWAGDFFGDPSKAVVLLDTEGLDDPEKGSASHDVNLFALAILLSSVFIYNTKGTIDAKSLDGLHLATEISKFIFADSRDEDQAEGENLGQHFPLFLWAIRDHHLKLEIKGKEVSSDEYLEFCLTGKKGYSDEVAKYNMLRNALKDFFPKRSCIVFPPPAQAEMMNILDQLPEENLAIEFKHAGKKFLKFLSENAETKKIKTTQITGASFGHLVTSLVESVLKKNICIESTHKYVTEKANKNASDSAINELKEFFQTLKENYPLSQEIFEIYARDAHLTACKNFIDFAINVEKTSEVFQEFEELVRNTIKKFNTENNEASTKKCSTLLLAYFQDIEEKDKRGEYMVPGGYSCLKREVEQIVKKYTEEQNYQELGPEFHSVLQKFQTEQFVPLLERTLLADEMMSDKEKRLKQAEMEKEQQQNLSRINQENYERAQNQLIQLEEAQKESIKLLETRMRENHDEQIRKLQDNMERMRLESEKNHLAANQEMMKRNQEDMQKLFAQLIELQQKPPVVIETGGGGCVIS